MQAHPVALTLSFIAKNIHSMQMPLQMSPPPPPTCCSHRRISLFPDIMFTFIPSSTSDRSCYLCLFMRHSVQSLKNWVVKCTAKRNTFNVLEILFLFSSLASQHVWRSPIDFYCAHDWLVRLISSHLPWNKGKDLPGVKL